MNAPIKMRPLLKNRTLRIITLVFFFELLMHQVFNSNSYFWLIVKNNDDANKIITRLPKIQFEFEVNNIIETTQEKTIREMRRDSIKKGFLHAWNGYSKYAWGYDELSPTMNRGTNRFNGWGATIVDSLDTLLIMDLKAEFIKSRDFVSKLNFTNSESESNIFETIIRYLGGLLSAFELSGDPIFLEKELGIALLPSFDSPTRLPYNDAHLNP